MFERLSGGRVGQNRRYAAYYARVMERAIVREYVMVGEPDSLTDEELDLDNEPMTRTRKPQPARAWVRYSGQAAEVDCLVHAWTKRACAISWEAQGGRRDRAWVWSSAVAEGSIPTRL